MSMYALTAFCQQDSLLKNFKFRNSNYKAINLNIGGNGQFNKTDFIAGTTKNSGGGGSVGVNYYTAQSTDKILLTASAGIGSYFNFAKSNNTGGVSRTNAFSVNPNFNVLNKWFSNSKFIELGADGTASVFTGKDKSNIPGTTSKQSQLNYDFAVNAGIGTGRLENITDMQNALWLSKALQASNSLLHPLSASELNELGRTITAANNTRVLDGRKRTQFVLTTIDNFFQQKGLIPKTDINYFSNLNDIVFFAFNTPRLSGTEKFIRFTPAITDYKNDNMQNNNASKYEGKANTKSLVLSTGFNKYTASSLIHQNNYGVSLNFSYNDVDFSDRYFISGTVTSEVKGMLKVKQASVNLFFEHAIYPNTRTIINFNLQPQLGYQDVNKQTSLFGQVDLTGSLNYFISYRTRFVCNLYGIYRNNVQQIQRPVELLPNAIQLNAGAGLIVSI